MHPKSIEIDLAPYFRFGRTSENGFYKLASFSLELVNDELLIL
ncbi:hypothetical protein D046_4799 [Vibrio parahaemolyticus V-223/04]|nr:hypothetical protein D046_4799 [Vibrio parahaemolyticus V-223/04]